MMKPTNLTNKGIKSLIENTLKKIICQILDLETVQGPNNTIEYYVIISDGFTKITTKFELTAASLQQKNYFKKYDVIQTIGILVKKHEKKAPLTITDCYLIYDNINEQIGHPIDYKQYITQEYMNMLGSNKIPIKLPINIPAIEINTQYQGNPNNIMTMNAITNTNILMNPLIKDQDYDDDNDNDDGINEAIITNILESNDQNQKKIREERKSLSPMVISRGKTPESKEGRGEEGKGKGRREDYQQHEASKSMQGLIEATQQSVTNYYQLLVNNAQVVLGGGVDNRLDNNPVIGKNDALTQGNQGLIKLSETVKNHKEQNAHVMEPSYANFEDYEDIIDLMISSSQSNPESHSNASSDFAKCKKYNVKSAKELQYMASNQENNLQNQQNYPQSHQNNLLSLLNQLPNQQNHPPSQQNHSPIRQNDRLSQQRHSPSQQNHPSSLQNRPLGQKTQQAHPSSQSNHLLNQQTYPLAQLTLPSTHQTHLLAHQTYSPSQQNTSLGHQTHSPQANHPSLPFFPLSMANNIIPLKIPTSPQDPNTSTTMAITTIATTTKHTLIKDLLPFKSFLLLKARIIKKTPKKPFNHNGKEGEFFSINLLDEKSHTIEGIFYDEAATKWNDILQEGKVYAITKGRVEQKKQIIEGQQNTYRIRFYKNSIFTLINDESSKSIPLNNFEFVKISDLKTHQINSVVDIAAFIRHAPLISPLHDRITIELFDDTNTSINLILKNDQVIHFKLNKNDLILLKNVKITENFNGRALSYSIMTQLYLNNMDENLTRIKELILWKKQNKNLESIRYSMMNNDVDDDDNESRVNVKNSRTLMEIQQLEVAKLNSNERIISNIKATIQTISSKTQHFCYRACPTCYKKVNQHNEALNCPSCGIITIEPAYKYAFLINIADQSGTLLIHCFDRVGELLLGISAKDFKVIEDLNDEDKKANNANTEDKIAQIINRLRYKEYDFHIESKIEIYHGKRNIIHIVNDIHHIKHQQENQKIINDMLAYDKMN